MLANRTKETTASTGTGNITLSGAFAGFQTLYSAFGLNKRFYYWLIDNTNNVWESGIGYLSTATTLVRENVLDNSNGTTAAINFTAIDAVFNSPSKFSNYLNFGVVGSGERHISTHLGATRGTKPWVADRICFVPFYAGFTNDINALTVGFSSVASTSAICGIYTNKNSRPDLKIVETSIFTPAAGHNSNTITQTNISSDWVWMAYLANGADTLRGAATNSQNVSSMSVNTNYHIPNAYFYADVASGWSSLPSIAPNSLVAVQNSTAPIIGVMTV